MRAKRSKRYRKTMAQYTLPPFSFREPYQVLLDAAFLRTCHAFHMPLQKFLENTLHGKCRLFVTRCSLSKVMEEWEREHNKGRKGGGGVKFEVKGRPGFLPPPTEVPLRHCKHNDAETVISEVDCLIDLLAGQPSGNEQPKNKQHFVLATADPTDAEKRNLGRAFVNVREAARNVPGVPIVYVKRSVMVLEEMSNASKRLKGGVERERLREGLVGGVGATRKRKRSEEEDEAEGGRGAIEGMETAGAGVNRRMVKKAKGPNPLSVKKKKPRSQIQAQQEQSGLEDTEGDHTISKELPEDISVAKAKRRRKHKANKGEKHETSDASTLHEVAAASLALQAAVT